MHQRGVYVGFDWSEYLNLARELAGQATSISSNEAKRRSAISRAYFAAFCSAKNHLEYKDHNAKIPPGGEAHGYVWRQFKESDNQLRREVGEDLNRLNTHRGKADYAPTISKIDDTTFTALLIAENVLSNLARL